jgi:hypothetical protein
MHYSLPLPAAVLGVTLVLGCGDQPAPAEPASASQPSLRTDRNPNGPARRLSASAFSL